MPRLAATLPARAALAAAWAVTAAGVAAAAPSDVEADGVVRLSVPAAVSTAADADADGVVIRAQNRAGRGRTRATRTSQSTTQPQQPQRTVAQPAPAPRPNVQRVAGVQPIPNSAAPGGVRTVAGSCENDSCNGGCSSRNCMTRYSLLHGGPHGAYADCPQCYGQCPPGGCPVCFGIPGLPCLPGCGLFGHGRGGLFVPQHIHNYSYNQPKNLLYPPGADPRRPGTMGPMPTVQYPYYTTKGPDDFFHDRDGEY